MKIRGKYNGENQKKYWIYCSLVGLLGIFYSIIMFIYNKTYQQDCEEFYKIPAKYFEGDLNEKILYIVFIIGLMAILIYPIIARNQDKKENRETKFTLIFYFGYMLIIGACISVLNVCFLDAILKNISINIFVNENGIITRVFVYFITYVGLMGLVFLDKINILKKSKKIVSLFVIICISLDALLLIGSTGCVLSKSIKDKSNYEIMYVNNKKYVVLSEYDDKILAVPLRIGKDGQYIFSTSKYEFWDRLQGKFKFEKLDKRPKIE